MRFIPIYPYSYAETHCYTPDTLQLHIAQDLIKFRHTNGTNLSPLRRAKIILDNGAFEGHQLLDNDRFIRTGRSIIGEGNNVEYVAPDVLKDANKTLVNLDLFAREYRLEFRQDLEQYYGTEYAGADVMFVPQGHDIYEWLDCLRMALARSGDIITTIGIPKWVAADSAFSSSVQNHFMSLTNSNKHGDSGNMLFGVYASLYDYFNDQPEFRNDVFRQITRLQMLWILKYFNLQIMQGGVMPNLQIHMLGLSNFTELGLHPELSRDKLPSFFSILKTVRSIDSSIVFNLTHNKNQTNKFLDIAYNTTLVGPPYTRMVDAYLNKLIDTINPITGMPDDVKRPDDFFDLPASDFSLRNVYNLDIALKTHLGRMWR